MDLRAASGKLPWITAAAVLVIGIAMRDCVLSAMSVVFGFHAFYADIASSTGDPEVRAMAKEFADEESEHVAELEKWIGRYTVQPGETKLVEDPRPIP